MEIFSNAIVPLQIKKNFVDEFIGELSHGALLKHEDVRNR